MAHIRGCAKLIQARGPSRHLAAFDNALLCAEQGFVVCYLHFYFAREIANFVKRYIKDPIESIAVREQNLLNLGLSYKAGINGDTLNVTIGTHSWVIQRPRRDEAVAPDEDDSGSVGA